MSNLHPGTPVYVEWWNHKRIPSKHYAAMVSYKQAREWFDQTPQPHVMMRCFTIDGDLLEELFQNGRS